MVVVTTVTVRAYLVGYAAAAAEAKGGDEVLYLFSRQPDGRRDGHGSGGRAASRSGDATQCRLRRQGRCG